MIYLNEEKLEDILTDELTIIDFYADWCGPCQMLGEVLEKLEEETKVKIIKINTDEHEELSRKFGVMSIPTIILYKNKEEIDKHIGFMSLDEIKDWIKEK